MLFFLCAGVVWMTAMGKGHLAAFASGGGWATIFLSSILKLDFRSDLDQLASLKALPLRPTVTAAGQLAVPVLLMSLVHLVLISSAAAIAKPEHRLFVLVALLFVVPFNIVLVAVENAMFLLFPTRVAGAAPGDLGQLGRTIVLFIVKLLTVVVVVGLSAGLGTAAGAVAGKSAPVGIAVALLALATFAMVSVPFVGWAYLQFDPSADTPA